MFDLLEQVAWPSDNKDLKKNNLTNIYGNGLSSWAVAKQVPFYN